MLLTDRSLSTLGYQFHQSLLVDSTERELEDLLKLFDVDLFSQITLKHPKVKKSIKILVNHLNKNNIKLPDDGSWIVYRSYVGASIHIAYVTFVPKSEITLCRVKDLDGNETNLFLKEFSAPTLEDFKYFDANGNRFEGEILNSDTLIYFHLKRILKNIEKQ